MDDSAIPWGFGGKRPQTFRSIAFIGSPSFFSPVRLLISFCFAGLAELKDESDSGKLIGISARPRSAPPISGTERCIIAVDRRRFFHQQPCAALRYP
jgi:hypothetical protein